MSFTVAKIAAQRAEDRALRERNLSAVSLPKVESEKLGPGLLGGQAFLLSSTSKAQSVKLIRSSLLFLWFGGRAHRVLEAIAAAGDLDDIGVMEKAIQDRCG